MLHNTYLLHHGTEKSVDTRLIRKTQRCPIVADVQCFGKAVQRPEVETQDMETEVKCYGKVVQRPEVETQDMETEVKCYGKVVQRPEVGTQDMETEVKGYGKAVQRLKANMETETQIAISPSHNELTPGQPYQCWN